MKRNLYLDLLKFSLAVPIFYIGFFISKFIKVETLSNSVIIIMFSIGLTLLLFESYNNLKHVGGDVLASLILICPSIFLFCLKSSLVANTKVFTTLSTGIYLVHVLIMEFFRRYYDIDETYLTFIVVIISILFTVALSIVNKKVKWIL